MKKFQQITGLESVTAKEWDNLAHNNTPFTRHAFLKALEDTGCVSGRSGWEPSHLILRDNHQTLIAALPAYLKYHSYGEYVFDWSWAEAYAKYRIDYYPKLLCAIPFTPATGPRLLGEHQHFEDMAQQLSTFCRGKNLSGWHLNFPLQEEALKLISGENEVHQRYGCQFHWFNDGYDSFEHYLTTFVSRKRKNVLKERRNLSKTLHIQRLTGVDITEQHIHFFYQCYLNTYQQKRSAPYLNEEFFQQLRQTMAGQILLVIAEDNEGPCASALYFYDHNTLYGRYWGALRSHDALHFEACYYQGIEFCIEHKLKRFDPGTQGEHKISRGFRPVVTSSVHWLAHSEFNSAIGHFIQEEQQHILTYQQEATTLLPFRCQPDN